jgi:enolase
VTDTISGIHPRKVWDSRGRPTVEVEVTLSGGKKGRAIAPAGASRGAHEAIDLRDGGEGVAAFGVSRALASVSERIAPNLRGLAIDDLAAIDARMIELDGTPNKAVLGGNATIAVSMACAHARAAARDLPLWRDLAGGRKTFLPLPEIQIFGGGAHAARRVDIQDFMVVANGAQDYVEALNWTARVYSAAGALLADAGRLAGVADEGGYWPVFDSNEEALVHLVQAIERAGLRPGEDVSIALDIAASEFFREGRYELASENRRLDRDGMIGMVLDWVGRYPIISVEDPLDESDAEGLAEFTRRAPRWLQIVGDDFLVTRDWRVQAAAAAGACNTVLVKPNQAGTLTETLAALDAAHKLGWDAIVSARSGETEDVTIVHLAVGWGARHLKVGSFARSERMAKWNEGLRIAEAIGAPDFAPREAFRWSGRKREAGAA